MDESENSDSEDNDAAIEGNLQKINEADQAQIDELEAQQEFQKVIKKWWKWIPYWKTLFPEKKFPTNPDATGMKICEPDPFKDLINIDTTHLTCHIEQYNRDNSNMFGYLPMLCRLSPCQLGALNSQIFVEQMNSCAKLVLDKKRTRLCYDLSDKLAVLWYLSPDKINIDKIRKFTRMFIRVQQNYMRAQ